MFVHIRYAADLRGGTKTELSVVNHAFECMLKTAN